MDLEVTSTEPGQSVVDNVETVEVVTGEDNDIDANSSSSGLMEQHIIVTNPQELMSNAELHIDSQALAASLAYGQPMSSISIQQQVLLDSGSPGTAQSLLGMKRSYHDSPGMCESGSDLPRKKSRNYLDSHKSIEKKRRDRINSCLNSLKSLVPDCRQYGNKKLDKAEILEMSIEYLQRMHNQTFGKGGGGGGFDSQREWASELTSWVLQNKLLFSGSNALDQFCQALMVHLQSMMGPQNSLSSATSILLSQSGEEDPLLRQQAQAVLLQHLQQQQHSPPKMADASSQQQHQQQQHQHQQQQQQQLAQAQLTQLQALLLLQQHQQLLSQQQHQHDNSDGQAQQLQQIQQLQALLLQHIANESQQKPHSQGSTGSSSSNASMADPLQALRVAASILTPVTSHREESVYTTNTLDDNLLQVSVNQADGHSEVVSTDIDENVEVSENGHMWSSGDPQQQQTGSSLLMLGGEGGNSKDQVIVEGDVQEEVVLLSNQEQ